MSQNDFRMHTNMIYELILTWKLSHFKRYKEIRGTQEEIYILHCPLFHQVCGFPRKEKCHRQNDKFMVDEAFMKIL